MQHIRYIFILSKYRDSQLTIDENEVLHRQNRSYRFAGLERLSFGASALDLSESASNDARGPTRAHQCLEVSVLLRMDFHEVIELLDTLEIQKNKN